MNAFQIKGFFLAFVLLFCNNSCTNQEETPKTTAKPSGKYQAEGNFLKRQVINHQQLSTWQTDSISVILIDTRPDSSFQKGHLEGAVSLWRPDIQSNLFPYKGMMLEKQALELVLGELGANSKSTFVLYDNSGNVDAARLWWILSTYGHSKTYLLDGGLRSAPKELVKQGKTLIKPATFSFQNSPQPNLKANKEDVFAALTDSNTVLLDCRTLDEFTGKTLKKNAFRAGHIPTAIHLNYTHSIAYHEAYEFKSNETLSSIFEAIPKNKKIIVYCQSGVRSAHTTFVLRKLLGYPNVANYDGSWIEWSYDKTLAIESGE
jgi:thiosulfate/3-mercaptopyruvate sulfurtransferase